MTDPAVLKSLLNMETVIAVASRTSTSSFLPASFLTPLMIYGTDWIAVHTARTGAGRKDLCEASCETLSHKLFLEFLI